MVSSYQHLDMFTHDSYGDVGPSNLGWKSALPLFFTLRNSIDARMHTTHSRRPATLCFSTSPFPFHLCYTPPAIINHIQLEAIFPVCSKDWDAQYICWLLNKAIEKETSKENLTVWLNSDPFPKLSPPAIESFQTSHLDLQLVVEDDGLAWGGRRTRSRQSRYPIRVRCRWFSALYGALRFWE